jgi:hypothetical protein
MHYPGSGSFAHTPWGWSNGDGLLSPGQTYTRTGIPADIQHYRLAVYWDEPDLTQAADIDVYVDAVYSAGGVCAWGFASQTDYSINNAIHLEASDIPSCAGSLQVRYVVYAMAAGTTRRVYNSELYDNETSY